MNESCGSRKFTVIGKGVRNNSGEHALLYSKITTKIAITSNMSNITVWDSISSNGRLKFKAYCIKAQILPDWVTDVCIAVFIAHSLNFHVACNNCSFSDATAPPRPTRKKRLDDMPPLADQQRFNDPSLTGFCNYSYSNLLSHACACRPHDV